MGINFFSDVMENKIEEIRALLNDIENDRVERTISTTNTDKFAKLSVLLPMTCLIINNQGIYSLG